MLHQSCMDSCVSGAEPTSRLQRRAARRCLVKSHKARADGLVKPFDARCKMRSSETLRLIVGCHHNLRELCAKSNVICTSHHVACSWRGVRKTIFLSFCSSHGGRKCGRRCGSVWRVPTLRKRGRETGSGVCGSLSGRSLSLAPSCVRKVGLPHSDWLPS